MKKYLFFVLSVVFCLACQSHKDILLYDYEVASKPTEAALQYEYFLTVHPEPFYLWCEPRTWRQIGDTAYYVVSENGSKDTIYVYNYQSYKTQKIPLTQVSANGIDAVYLHTTDSIFIFYDRYYILQKRNNNVQLPDMVLIDGKGNVKGTYSLDGVPYMKNENTNYNFVGNKGYGIIGNRIVGDEMLLTFYTWPACDSADYAGFNPKIAGMYNLKTGNIRMLNIRYPSLCVGKKYEGHRRGYWVALGHNNDIFVGFEFMHEIFRYDMLKDTMKLWNNKYDNAFVNADSASIKPDDAHMALRFDDPQWNEASHCYMRLISIISYKDYKPWQEVLQIMDSNFHHLGYAPCKKDYTGVPRMMGNAANVKSKADRQRHNVTFAAKAQKISMCDWENTYLNQRDEPTFHDSIFSIKAYFDLLNIPPKQSLVLIINTKYPCSSCYDYLLSAMQEHAAEYEEKNIYFVIYDPHDGQFAKALLKEHGLVNAKNMRIDTYMLEKLFMPTGYSGVFFKWDSDQFTLVDYLYDGEKSSHMSVDFSVLQMYFPRNVSGHAGQKPKEE